MARWKSARAWDRSRDRESEDQKQRIQTNFSASLNLGSCLTAKERLEWYDSNEEGDIKKN